MDLGTPTARLALNRMCPSEADHPAGIQMQDFTRKVVCVEPIEERWSQCVGNDHPATAIPPLMRRKSRRGKGTSWNGLPIEDIVFVSS